MKILFLLLVVCGAGYYLYLVQSNPATIENPYYAEARVEFRVQSRDLSMVIMGEMVDRDDCEKRGQRFWRSALEKCETCQFVDYHCKSELSERYQMLFDKYATYTTYIAAERGNRYERNGRMIVWGLSTQESDQVCKYLINTMKSTYKGHVSCIAGLNS